MATERKVEGCASSDPIRSMLLDEVVASVGGQSHEPYSPLLFHLAAWKGVGGALRGILKARSGAQSVGRMRVVGFRGENRAIALAQIDRWRSAALAVTLRMWFKEVRRSCP